MLFFQTLSGYVSAAKNKITSTVHSIWKNDDVQAIYQGYTAPIYSYSSYKNLVSSSQDLQTTLSDADALNKRYALYAFSLYFLYYRIVHPVQEYSEEQKANTWLGSAGQYGLYGIDFLLLWGMYLYLKFLGHYNTKENVAFTSSMTCTASRVMPPSHDFKPCDPRACGTTQVAKLGIDSFIFYLANRYLVNYFSWKIANHFPGYSGKALSFGLEAVSIGFPLVEYKLNAVERCTLDKYKELLTTYRTYCIAYGASFVTATWASSYLLSAISGSKNSYIYDAIFSFMYQRYALLSIARKEKIPGNDNVNFDVMAWVRYFNEKPLIKSSIEKCLGDYYSPEKFVQSPGMSRFLTVHDKEIRGLLSYLKNGIKQLKDIQSSRILSAVKWISSWLPYEMIPQELKNMGQSFSKTALSKMIRYIEYLLDLARDADLQRNAQINQTIVARDDHFIASEVTPARLQIEYKTDVPIENPAPMPVSTVNADQPLVNFLVENSYFKESKIKENEKKSQSVALSKNTAMLFSKKDGALLHKYAQKPDSLAAMTASIISNTKQRKVL